MMPHTSQVWPAATRHGLDPHDTNRSNFRTRRGGGAHTNGAEISSRFWVCYRLERDLSEFFDHRRREALPRTPASSNSSSYRKGI